MRSVLLENKTVIDRLNFTKKNRIQEVYQRSEKMTRIHTLI